MEVEGDLHNGSSKVHRPVEHTNCISWNEFLVEMDRDMGVYGSVA